MNEEQAREKFADLISGSLEESDAAELSKFIESSEPLRMEFAEYKLISKTLIDQSEQSWEPGSDFSEQVMSRLKEQQGIMLRLTSFLQNIIYSKSAAGAVAGLALLLIVFTIPEIFKEQVLISDVYDTNSDTPAVIYSDQRQSGSINGALTFIQGTLGAILVLGAGILALIALLLRCFRIAFAFLFISIMVFAIRSFVGTFFNDTMVQALNYSLKYLSLQ